MIVLDACAVIAVLNDEPAADEVATFVTEGAALTAVGLGELYDHRIRRIGRSRRDTAADLTKLGILDPIVVDESVGSRAGILRATYYRRWRAKLSMADCIAAAAAESLGAPLATSDAHLLDMSYKEGIEVRPLPNHTGEHAWVEPHD